MADESDDRAGEREVLTNLPRTRPARRSSRRAPAEAETAPAPKPRAERAAKPAAQRAPAKPAAKRAPAKRAPAKPGPARREQAAPPLPPSRPEHRSPLGDLAVTSIELSGALFQMGMDITRAIVRSTIGRMPRP